MAMLEGERPDSRKVALVLGLIAGAVVLIALKLVAPSIDDMDVVPPPAFVTVDHWAAVDEQLQTLEVDVAAAKAATLLLQDELRTMTAAHAADIAELKAALAAAAERQAAKVEQRPARRDRKAVPDPPASSYLKLQ